MALSLPGFKGSKTDSSGFLIVQFMSVQSFDRLNRPGGHEGRFSRDPLPVFSARGPCEQFWHGQGCPLFGVVHPAFPLPTTASPTLQRAMKDGVGEAVMACEMPEPCKFPSLDLPCGVVPKGLLSFFPCFFFFFMQCGI